MQEANTPYQKQKQNAFHDRPLCTAAFGVLLGTALSSALLPPDCYAASALIAAVAAAARFARRDRIALLCCCIATALVSAGLRAPADGAFAYSGPVVPLPKDGFGGALIGLREALGARILRLFPENGGVAAGMLLGEKGAIAAPTLAAFQNVGIMHLLAVSGLHVSVLAGAFRLLFRRNPWVRFGAVALFVTAYALLTALSPSVVRAGILLLCAMLARPLLCRPDPPDSLALAFLLILLANPMALFYTGFQLSFCAAYGLILLTARFSRPFRRIGTAASGVLGGTLAVTVSTLPAMALAFGRVQLSGVLANLFILPIVPAFIIPAFCSVLLSYVFAPLALPFAVTARLALRVIVAFSHAGGALDLAVAAPGPVAYLAYLAALLYLSPLCLLNQRQRYARFLLTMGGAMAAWLAGV